MQKFIQERPLALIQKVGGEVNNYCIFGYSNKGHDGFLGNSVIGEWCNLGADSNTSNLKNTYDFVRIWSYNENTFISTGLQFCGLIMGDHSKSGINTMFNTGDSCRGFQVIFTVQDSSVISFHRLCGEVLMD